MVTLPTACRDVSATTRTGVAHAAARQDGGDERAPDPPGSGRAAPSVGARPDGAPLRAARPARRRRRARSRRRGCGRAAACGWTRRCRSRSPADPCPTCSRRCAATAPRRCTTCSCTPGPDAGRHVRPRCPRPVRAGLAARPCPWRGPLGLRLGGPRVAAAALLLLAVNPFAVRYATEARMYALVQLLGALALLAVLRALEDPRPARLVPVGLLSGALALTHYWSLFLLAAAAVVLARAGRAGRRRPRRPARAGRPGGRPAAPAALAARRFLFQLRRTGAPWAQQPHLVDLWYALTAWSGGGTGPAVVLALLVLGLLVLALVGHRQRDAVVLRAPVDRPSRPAPRRRRRQRPARRRAVDGRRRRATPRATPPARSCSACSSPPAAPSRCRRAPASRCSRSPLSPASPPRCRS